MEVENGPERKTIFHHKQVVVHVTMLVPGRVSSLVSRDMKATGGCAAGVTHHGSRVNWGDIYRTAFLPTRL